MSRLAEFGIEAQPLGPKGTLYVRGKCIGMVAGGDPANQSSTGYLTDSGLSYLVWREGQPSLTGRGGAVPATAEQIEEIRQFTEDLKLALST